MAFGFKNPFRGKNKGKTPLKQENKNNTPPVKGGRQSEPETGTITLNTLIEELAIISPDFQFQLINVLKHLAKYNADVSYAVENIVTLGNTEHKIEFDDSVSDEQRKEMMESIKMFKDEWYGFSNGENSMINDLLAQIAVTGALSAEIMPAIDLKSVEGVVLVGTENIRFIYDKEKLCYMPYQQSKKMISTRLIELNPHTYKYLGFRKFSEKPYGIPPFLSALENVAIERDMVENLKHVTKKLGVLGFLRVLVNAPNRKPGEKDTAWYARCQTYLNSIVPEIEKSMAKGYVVGFKDTHEFEMENVTTNVQGAKDLFQINNESKMAGLKQDPMMLGRNYNTSETLGRVMLRKLTSQVENYQKTVAAFLKHLYKMHLLLQGYKFNYITVVFEKPMLGDESKQQSAMKTKIENADLLYDNGTIDQTQRAQMLGYDEPAEEEPRDTYKSSGSSGLPSLDTDEEDNDDESDNTDPDTDVENNWRELPWIKQ